MSLKENLKTKIRLDRLVKKIEASIRTISGQRKVDKEAVKELLGFTDYQHIKARDLHLYVRPLHGKTQEILVLDNELPLYHSTVADVAMRKTPRWKEMFSIRNVKKILDDSDVVVCKGKDTLQLLYSNAVSRLDFSFGKKDIDGLVIDAQIELNKKSAEGIREALELFFELLDYKPIEERAARGPMSLFAQSESDGEAALVYENIVIFDDLNAQVQLVKGPLSTEKEVDKARLTECAQGRAETDLEGEDVFMFLAELALATQKNQP